VEEDALLKGFERQPILPEQLQECQKKIDET